MHRASRRKTAVAAINDLATIDVSPLDARPYVETKYGISVNVTIPPGWNENQRNCWDLIEKMRAYTKRYQQVWWSRSSTRAAVLLHDIEKWHLSIIQWISADTSGRELSCSRIIHTFNISEVLSTVFAAPPGITLTCHGVEVDYKADRYAYFALYSDLLIQLRTMVVALDNPCSCNEHGYDYHATRDN